MSTTAEGAPDMATSAISDSSTAVGTQSAAVKTFSVAELLEHILTMGNFSPFELRALLRVNTSFKDTIAQSKALSQVFRFESDNGIPFKQPSESALTSFALSANNPLSRAFKPFRFERYINDQAPGGLLAILSSEFLLQDRGDQSEYSFSESHMPSSWRCLPNPFPEYEWVGVSFELGGFWEHLWLNDFKTFGELMDTCKELVCTNGPNARLYRYRNLHHIGVLTTGQILKEYDDMAKTEDTGREQQEGT